MLFALSAALADGTHVVHVQATDLAGSEYDVRGYVSAFDIDSGRLIVVIGVAPVKPAEFVIIRIGLMTATNGQ